ncbi:hypothetical protein VCRA2113O221_270006 [Vibrio crassostreae]|nr:hypothetical protein VCHA49P379_280006 [Vibrio chagasii]CAK1938876.1 hypothetical protein VCRA2113O221_270006 [Vibrio crassostreae]CAK1945202.1 hypothetical protein VCRA2113O222_270062 [Vibrio crassostreae]CAK1958493.1 hypothetical protein VCRA2113O197_270061 [Vibrio crassostreae]CAK1967040.1 hypothetical protein VCRA2113O196_290062 [Vibrio crassostreae]
MTPYTYCERVLLDYAFKTHCVNAGIEDNFFVLIGLKCMTIGLASLIKRS